MLDKTPNQSSNYKTKKWVEVNDDLQGTYSTDNQITFKTSILKCGSCDYSDEYVLFKGTITVPNTGTAAVPNNRHKEVIFKNCFPFTN